MKQENFLFVDVVSSIFLLILMMGNFMGLLYITSGNYAISLLISLFIVVCYYFIIQVLKKNKEIKAVDGIDFEVKRGEILAIIGESGSGKTTIGKLIMNLITPTEGKILFENEDINSFKNEEMKNYRKKVQAYNNRIILLWNKYWHQIYM